MNDLAIEVEGDSYPKSRTDTALNVIITHWYWGCHRSWVGSWRRYKKLNLNLIYHWYLFAIWLYLFCLSASLAISSGFLPLKLRRFSWRLHLFFKLISSSNTCKHREIVSNGFKKSIKQVGHYDLYADKKLAHKLDRITVGCKRDNHGEIWDNALANQVIFR